MSTNSSVLKARALRWIMGVLGLAIFFYVVPLFHIVSLKTQQEKDTAALFDASSYVDQFWQGPLSEAAKNAVDVSVLVAALEADAEKAAEIHGHRLGLSSKVSYYMSIEGYVVSVSDGIISIALNEDGAAIAQIEIGPVFGNAIRDGSGLIDVSDFANAQDFNAISSAINMRVEEKIFPALAQGAELGKKIHAVGGVELSDDDGAPTIFNLVPTHIEFE